MAMDTATVQKIRKHNLCLVGIMTITSWNLSAADMEFMPFVKGGITATDNVDLDSSNTQSSQILTLTAGIDLNIEGNDGNLLFAYELKQLVYSHDSNENERYNQLDFTADKTVFDKRFVLDASASIENIASSILDNASEDIYTGETVESKSFDAGLSYQSNPGGIVDLYGRISGGIYAYEDNIGDYNDYSAVINFSEGSVVKDYFWQADYAGTRVVGRDSSDSSDFQSLEQDLGIQRGKGLSPFVRSYFEKYSSEATGEEIDFSSWGLGLRYYIHDESYVEVSRDFALDDDSEDYWRGAVYLNPTSRTSLEFEYTNRFYGDAYEFALTHKNRRLTNEISYTEEVTNYDRDFFIDGDSIEQLMLNRVVSWTTSLELRRTTASLGLNGGINESISDEIGNSDTLNYGGNMSLTHSLTRNMSASTSFNYDYYEFDPDALNSQRDYYRTWELGLERSFARELTMDVTIAHQNKSSTVSDGYKENKITFNITKGL